MMTVREVADRYGASTGFVVRALALIGCPGMSPDSALTDGTVVRFERAYADRVRAARPSGGLSKPEPPVMTRDAHVMRVAHEHISGKKDKDGYRYKVLAENPGVAHAIDAAGTREGDPWRGAKTVAGHKFFENRGPRAACGAQVQVVMSEEFDPQTSEAALCPKCVSLVAADRGFRSPPGEWQWQSTSCDAFLRLVNDDGRVAVPECRQRRGHSGPHRTRDGATWEVGAEDFVPAPDGAV